MKMSLILIFAILLFGCGSQHCIKVGGSYEGIQGELEYCFGSSDEMKSLAAPIITSQSEKFIGISEKEASIILEKIEPKQEEGNEISLQSKEKAFVRLKNLLKK